MNVDSNYKDLKVWNKAMDLTVEVYGLVRYLPKEEQYALSDQLRRAVVSVPSNIAEGHGRSSNKGFIQFLCFARGSLREIETQLEICIRLMMLRPELTYRAKQLITEISKMINSLISYLSSNPITKTKN